MKLENFVASMMRMNTLGRLWHWGTSSAQHHVTFEKFLTENEQHTDSFVESIFGNDVNFQVSNVNVQATIDGAYDLATARDEIKRYRSNVREIQAALGNEGAEYEAELTAILDGVNELCSKTLYLLNLK